MEGSTGPHSETVISSLTIHSGDSHLKKEDTEKKPAVQSGRVKRFMKIINESKGVRTAIAASAFAVGLVQGTAGEPRVWDDLAAAAKPFVSTGAEMNGQQSVSEVEHGLDFEVPPPDKEQEQPPISASSQIEASPPPPSNNGQITV